MNILYQKHPFSKKQSTFTRKIAPLTKFYILRHYLAIKNNSSKSFSSVNQLAVKYRIHRNTPCKIYNLFIALRYLFYPNCSPDFSLNIFQKAHSFSSHYFDLNRKNIDYLKKFLKRFPRAGYHTYLAYFKKEINDNSQLLSKSSFIYYKPLILKYLGKTFKPKSYRNKKEASKAKDFFDDFYKKFDFIINLDGKCLQDIYTIQKNPSLSTAFKRISQPVEIKSGCILGLFLEKSHNKSNSFFIIQKITNLLKSIFGEHIKILFLTDAGSEYINDKSLRGLLVSELDSSQIACFLRKNYSDLLITRKKQDNGFIENKNKYIETACLDNSEIIETSKTEFIEKLQDYIDINNYYLEGSNKYVYR